MDGIIDFDKKGNLVRFYIGDISQDYYGDDWDDTPYEHNAGKVYDEYIKGYVDVMFPFDWIVLEPCDGEYNSPWCKDDFKKRKTPCIISIKDDLIGNDDFWNEYDYSYWIGRNDIYKFYYGDNIDSLIKTGLEIREECNFAKFTN